MKAGAALLRAQGISACSLLLSSLQEAFWRVLQKAGHAWSLPKASVHLTQAVPPINTSMDEAGEDQRGFVLIISLQRLSAESWKGVAD